jgi:glutamine amidotransferase PdxT
MAQEHIEELRKARSALVSERRSRAKALVIPGARTSTALMSFIEVQQAIEAIDRAIKDEKSPPA